MPRLPLKKPKRMQFNVTMDPRVHARMKRRCDDYETTMSRYLEQIVCVALATEAGVTKPELIRQAADLEKVLRSKRGADAEG